MIPGWSRGRKWFVFSLLFLCHVYFFQSYPNFISPNEYSRFLLTSAIVDYGTVQIDRPILRFGDTQDKSQYEGHFYSDKAIGTSLFCIPFYLALKFLGALFGISWSTTQLLIVLRIFSVTIPCLIFLSFFSRFCFQIQPDGYLVPGLLFLFLFGTVQFTYSLQLISHPLFGVFLFLSFYCVFRSRQVNDSATNKYLACSGLFSGLTLITEYAAVFPAAVIFLYLFWTISKKRNVVYYLLPVLPFVSLTLAYNYSIFGTPFDVTYRHQQDPFHAGAHAGGIVGIGVPAWEAIYGLLFSHHHGMFFFSPFLIFALPGFLILVKRAGFRKEAWLMIGVVVSCILFYSSFSYWVAGWNFGPRYLTSIVPFLAVPVLAFFGDSRIRAKQWTRFAGIFAAMISVVFVTIGTITFPYPPDEIGNPFFVLNLPLFFRGAVSENLGELLLVTPAGSIILFYTLLLMTFFAMALPRGSIRFPGWRTLAPWLFSVGVVASILLLGSKSADELSAFDHYARGSVYFYLGKYDSATKDLQSALSRGADAHLKRLIGLRLREISYLEGRGMKIGKNTPLFLLPLS